MANYGVILDDYSPEIEEMYKDFSLYLNNPKMIKLKDVDIYSMYIAKNYCLLSNQCRYIISLILKDSNIIGTNLFLDDMKWKSLQTRTLSEKYDLPAHSYTATRNSKLNTKITRTGITDKSSTYTCEKYPITITLLHTQKNTTDKPSYEYQDTGLIISALETFQTIITIN